MSLSDVASNVRTYPVISASASEIPQSCLSSSAPRPMPGRIGLKQTLSQTGSQNSSGTLLFPLGCGSGQGFLKAGSCVLAATITVTQNPGSWYFNQGLDASAIIQRSTVYINGAIVDQQQFYNRVNATLDQHCSTQAYYNNDLTVMSNAGGVDVGALSTTFSIPIKSGVLNAQHDLPLFLLNTCQVELNLESVASALFQVSVNALSEYSISNARLLYEVFYPEVEYENSMRAVLASGKLWQCPIKQWYNLQVSNLGATKSQPIGLNKSSVLAIFTTCQTDNGLVSVQHKFTGDTPAGQGLRVFCDGQLVNNYSIVDTNVIFHEKSRAMGTLQDPERSAVSRGGASLTRALYLSDSFLQGVALMKTQESGFSMAGTAVSQAVVEVTNAGTAGNLYIFVAYESILTIDAMGSASIIQ
jgi:hypothetical protein